VASLYPDFHRKKEASVRDVTAHESTYTTASVRDTTEFLMRPDGERGSTIR